MINHQAHNGLPNGRAGDSRPKARALLVAAVVSAFVGGNSLAESAKTSAPSKNAAKKASKKTTAPSKTKKSPSRKRARTKKAPQIPIEMVPYRVRVSIAFGSGSVITPAQRRNVLKEIANAVRRSYGQMWTLDLRSNDWIPLGRRVGLERVSAEDILTRFLPDKPGARMPFGKLLLLTVERNGPLYSFAGREWDSKSRKIGPVEVAQTTEPREVGRKLFSLLPRLFHPVLKIENIGMKNVDLRLQAAAFPANDPAMDQLKTGDVLVPFFRYLDKAGTLQRIRHVDWTYLSVETIDGQYVVGSQVTDRMGRLGTGRTRGVEIFASLIRRRLPFSRLKMVYQSDETKPLVGYHINLVAKKFYRDKAKNPPIERFSGRDGIVEIPVVKDFPIVWVYVYSGGALLARVPYVPGITNGETIALPDDSIRLGVEGRISLLKGELIDAVARRATLMALAKQIYDDEKIPEAKREKMIEEKRDLVFALPGADEFKKKVDVIRDPAVRAAERLGNRFAARKITQICGKTKRLIDKFLDKAPVQKFFKQLEDGELDTPKKSKSPKS